MGLQLLYLTAEVRWLGTSDGGEAANRLGVSCGHAIDQGYGFDDGLSHPDYEGTEAFVEGFCKVLLDPLAVVFHTVEV